MIWRNNTDLYPGPPALMVALGEASFLAYMAMGHCRWEPNTTICVNPQATGLSSCKVIYTLT